MRAVVQRVSRASVSVGETVVGRIGTGVLALVAATHDDTPARAAALGAKIVNLRILRDELSVRELPGAAVLVISQFTLYGDARKGRRPTWAAAAPGPVAEPMVDEVVRAIAAVGVEVQTGRFGADMSVELVNDGPMTVLLEL